MKPPNSRARRYPPPGVKLCGVCCIAVCLAGVSGCQESASTGLHISGIASYGDKPIPYGRVEFIPEPVRPNQLPDGEAEIMEGTFDTRSGGRPAAAGPHVVRIYGFQAEPGQIPPLEERIPLFNVFETRVEITPEQPEYRFEVPRSSR